MNKDQGDSYVLVVTNNYPSYYNPYSGIFVHTLVREFSKLGSKVSVIVPRPFWQMAKRDIYSSKVSEYDNGKPTIFQPGFLPFSNKLLPNRYSTFRLTSLSFSYATMVARRWITRRPSVVYGHFLYPAGCASLKLASYWNVPAVVALGEGNLSFYEKHIGVSGMTKTIHQFAGILSVCQENKVFCVERLKVPENRIIVIPNAVDVTHFYPRDRTEMRQKHNLPTNCFLVVFVGHFDCNKGPIRLMNAIKCLPEVRVLFLGEGTQKPIGPQVLYRGRVANEQMPEWLSASDIFVLPTLREASSNAIAEALACGLPIVSSDIPSVRAIVGDNAGLFVKPHDENAITNAVKKLLYNPELRQNMSRAAFQKAHSFTIRDRGQRILDWIRSLVKDNKLPPKY